MGTLVVIVDDDHADRELASLQGLSRHKQKSMMGRLSVVSSTCSDW